jgi:hypothetical protein
MKGFSVEEPEDSVNDGIPGQELRDFAPIGMLE